MAENGKFYVNTGGRSDANTEAGLAINAAQSDKAAGGDGVVDIIADGQKVGQVSIHGDHATLAEELKDKMN
ncbi:hypothetical protein [Actinomadura citrea]|jgi:hypothetical protein|uniref:Uncharacterized protein n=1 Tax=Actinomadura citrea TaxID=46158 RepID=A0A7Y9GIF2_9ACTN|nr:hypothetical protein [Actinomadura citrea]NYE16931.1 hypothetical protein [Actinomadura citrea]GGT59003.1 hypothetical protein GCM10010177_14370 [Actinomadura citrea]